MAMAMPSLIREVPGARLFLMERGKKGPRLRDLCRELGLCNREDMHHVFQGVDASIFASFNAGRGACVWRNATGWCRIDTGNGFETAISVITPLDGSTGCQV